MVTMEELKANILKYSLFPQTQASILSHLQQPEEFGLSFLASVYLKWFCLDFQDIFFATYKIRDL